MKTSSIAAAMALLDQCDTAFASELSWSETVRFFLAAIAQGNDTKTGIEQIIGRLDTMELEKAHLRKAELPIKVPEIIKTLNLTPGPEVGIIVESLRAAFRNEEWFSKPEALAWLKKHTPAVILKKQ